MRCEERAELRLPTGTLGEHHQTLGHAQRHFSAMIPRQQVQRQINPRRDPGRGVERAVLDIQAIRFDLRRRTQLRQRDGVVPVRGDGAPVQQTGPGQHERAVADRTEALRPCTGLTQPTVERRAEIHEG
ncbi:hypothetical protein D3C81_1631560 [compost metagenome]